MIKRILFLYVFICFQIYSQTISLDIIEKNNIQYFSINEFIYKNNLKSTYYQAKEKLEILYEGNKIYFSPHSSYCRINETSYHMVYKSVLVNNNLFIPVVTFQSIITKSKLAMRVVEINNKEIKINTNIYNIHDFYIDKKENGFEISIHTTEKFTEKNIATSMNSGGWLNITILNSHIDSLGLHKSKLRYPITDLKTVQSEKSSQISFYINNKVDDVIINSSDKNINILVSTKQNEYAEKIQELRNKKLIDTIVIDAGHGGKDPGAIGINKLQEKEVTLDIAKQLTRMLEKNTNLKIINTRDEDVFIPLWQRTQIANNAEGDIFISIHANSTAKSKSINGFETFLLRVGKTEEAIEVAKRENSVIALEQNQDKYTNLTNEQLILATMVQNSDMKASEKLASIIQDNLAKKITTSRNRGVKQAGFHVLVGASMPNVLVEVGFLSNLNEAKNLSKYQYRKKIAAALYDSIIDYKAKYE